MKAVGYIRVSTEQQAGEGVSLEAQKAKIEAWCLANDCELVGVHVDAGISGKSMEKRWACKWLSMRLARAWRWWFIPFPVWLVLLGTLSQSLSDSIKQVRIW